MDETPTPVEPPGPETTSVTGHNTNADQTTPPPDSPMEGTFDSNETELTPAGFWPRLWAFCIDFAALSLMHEILLLISGVELPGPAEAVEAFSLSIETLMSGGDVSPGSIARMAELNRPVLFSGWLNVALCGAYFTVFHGISGQTLGKVFLGIRVLRTDGTPVGVGWALLRYVCYLISSKLLYTVWVMPFDVKRRTLYDILLGTNVFKVNR